ncbi:MAG: hypothetical protein ISR65_13320 [Bacteriovoracaceae bacterium]|nr:hypothetical protein [Bacteriovoracaceae bacterium]
MKDHTSNFSSQEATHFNDLSRLYFVTGKGGVGKTTLSLALTRYLKSCGLKAHYICFTSRGDHKLSKDLKISYQQLDIAESVMAYIADKLGSKLIASWILKTPFFKSIFDMVPGVSDMILLGDIVDKLMKDPELIIVLDSPSSGHTIAMLESPHNFKEMFGKDGILTNDIKKMHKSLYSANFFKGIVCTLPTPLAIHEGMEVKNFLQSHNFVDIDLVLNNSLVNTSNLKMETLPSFLKEKIKFEQEIQAKYSKQISQILPHSIYMSKKKIICELEEKMEKLV